MEMLYEEQLTKKNHEISELKTALVILRRIAEREIPTSSYMGTNPDAKLIVEALLHDRARGSAFKMKAEQAVGQAKANETFANSCIDRLTAVVRYATANFQPLSKHRADLVAICNGQPINGEEDTHGGEETTG
jgi:hypothetical protein